MEVHGKYFEYLKKNSLKLNDLWDRIKNSQNPIPSLSFSGVILFLLKLILIPTVLVALICSPLLITSSLRPKQIETIKTRISDTKEGDVLVQKLNVYSVFRFTNTPEYYAYGSDENNSVLMIVSEDEYNKVKKEIDQDLADANNKLIEAKDIGTELEIKAIVNNVSRILNVKSGTKLDDYMRGSDVLKAISPPATARFIDTTDGVEKAIEKINNPSTLTTLDYLMSLGYLILIIVVQLVFIFLLEAHQKNQVKAFMTN